MANKRCDLTELRSVGMRKAQERLRLLRKAGVPVTGELFGELLKLSYAEAKEVCSPVSYEVTEEQLAAVLEICKPCADLFTVKKKEGE